MTSTGTTQTIRHPFRVLMVTGAYPTEKLPHKGTFIKSQADSLSAVGVEIEVLHPGTGPILLRYPLTIMRVFLKTLTGHFDIVHGHYGQWCLFARMQWTTPVVASFLGDDLLGTVTTSGSYSTMSRLVVRMSHWLCRRVDAVIVKSEGMKKAASGCRTGESLPSWWLLTDCHKQNSCNTLMRAMHSSSHRLPRAHPIL